MRIFALAFALFIIPFTTMAQEAVKIEAMPAGLYKMDPTHASLTWKVDHMGMSKYTARFKKFNIDLLFNNLDVTKSRVKAAVNPMSVETDYPDLEKKDFNKELSEGKQWLNSEQFPEITFNSTKVEITGNNTGKLTGDLTFLGVTKPVTFDITLNKPMGNHPFANKPALGFSATGSIKRSDFGLNTYIPTVGDEVQIIIEAEFIYAG